MPNITDSCTHWAVSSFSTTAKQWLTVIISNRTKIISVTKEASSWATRCMIIWSDSYSWTILAQATYVWAVATFNYELAPWTYLIANDNNWSTYTNRYWAPSPAFPQAKLNLTYKRWWEWNTWQWLEIESITSEDLSHQYWEYLSNVNTKAYYRLNWNSKDYSSSWFHWTDTNMTYTEAAWRYWKWAVFNGSSSKVVLPASIVNNANAITVSVWAKATGAATSWDWKLFDARNATNWIIIRRENVNWFSFYSHFWTGVYSPSYWLLTNERHMFTITVWWWNAYYYIDWVLRWSNATWSTAWTSTSARLWNEFNDWAQRYYNWYMDEVILEYRQWSSKELADYYSYTKWAFIPNLI